MPREESLSELARRWSSVLKRSPRATAAGDLYVGRAMAECKRVVRLLGADLYVVSAGLGLVHETQLVPHYDLTVSKGPLQAVLASSGKSAASWWSLLLRQFGQTPFAQLVDSNPRRLALVALPASYLRLIVDDLASIPGDASERVRIVTSEAGRAELPAHLRRCCLPYDERLESLTGYDGTRSEFPQRALCHFIFALGGHRLSLRDATTRVAESLDGLTVRAIPERKRRSDEQISRMLDKKWESYDGSSTRLLRYLRDDALVACEQGRFRSLWHQLRTERSQRRVEPNAT